MASENTGLPLYPRDAIAWADRIAAIREGLGKAQEEAVAWRINHSDAMGGPVFTKEPLSEKAKEGISRLGVSVTPLCECATTPADSVQVLEQVAKWAMSEGFATGHADTMQELLDHISEQLTEIRLDRDSAQVLVEAQWRAQYDEMRDDYQRYQDGDPMMPFSTFRLSLALFLEETDKSLAAHKSEVKG